MTANAIDPSWSARVLAAPPGVGRVRLVCVDGPAGAGKTTFASDFASALRSHVGFVPVVHADEVYEGWDVVADAPDRVAAFAALARRVEQWLFEPWRIGQDGHHRVWDWHTSRWGPTVAVPGEGVVILEGVGLGSQVLREHAALSVWIDADAATCLARVIDRDGGAVGEQMHTWQRDEATWHRIDATRESSDVHLTTG